MTLLQHPGPEAAERFTVVPCQAHPLRLVLRAGRSLADAVVQAFGAAGFDAGYLRVADARLSRVDYVIPAPAQGDGRAAWYSKTYSVGDARVIDAGVHLGVKDGASFLHCHAMLQDADGKVRMGHLLCFQSVLTADVAVEGWGLSGARYVVRTDVETGFDLFNPEPADPCKGGCDALLCTLRPNEDIHALLGQIADGPMSVEGIGSLVDTDFGHEVLASYATEILLRQGTIAEGQVVLQAASVGFDGGMQQGTLRPNANRICITAEILMIQDAVLP